MLDFKFVEKNEVCQRQDFENFQPYTIEGVLDEMLSIKSAYDQGQFDWLSCYSEKLAPANSATMTARLQHISSMEQTLSMQSKNVQPAVDDTVPNEEDMEEEEDESRD